MVIKSKRAIIELLAVIMVLGLCSTALAANQKVCYAGDYVEINVWAAGEGEVVLSYCVSNAPSGMELESGGNSLYLVGTPQKKGIYSVTGTVNLKARSQAASWSLDLLVVEREPEPTPKPKPANPPAATQKPDPTIVPVPDAPKITVEAKAVPTPTPTPTPVATPEAGSRHRVPLR